MYIYIKRWDIMWKKRQTLDRFKTYRSLEVSLCLRKSIIWLITSSS